MSESDFRQYRGDGERGNGGRTSALREDKGRYLADERLATAVNTAIAAGRPLLLTGEPGCGKSSLAYAIADELSLGKVYAFTVRSDSLARDILYTFDHLGRLYDAQSTRSDGDAKDLEQYFKTVALGAAIEDSKKDKKRRVVLIDEVDKASRDFPNDLLGVIDELDFYVPELRRWIQHEPEALPIVIVTSNVERQLPEPFLRRCVYHHIAFPNTKQLNAILIQRLGNTDQLKALSEIAVARFEQLRKEELVKAPATSELLAWVRVLLRAHAKPQDVSSADWKDLYPGSLLKTRQDLERIAGKP